MKKLLTVDEVGELLGINRPRIWELSRLYERTNGKQGLLCIRLGLRQLRFSRAAIERFVDGSEPESEKREPRIY